VKSRLALDSGETAGNVKIAEVKNASNFRTTPWKKVFIDWPRKNTATVGAQKICRGERSTQRNDAIDGFFRVLEIDQVTIMGHV
jgi:hypothetical protein